MAKFTINDYKVRDLSGYNLREVNRITAVALHFDYAVFFTLINDNKFYIHTWLSFNTKQKIGFPDFDNIDKYFVDSKYVTDEVIKEYTNNT